MKAIQPIASKFLQSYVTFNLIYKVHNLFLYIKCDSFDLHLPLDKVVNIYFRFYYFLNLCYVLLFYTMIVIIFRIFMAIAAKSAYLLYALFIYIYTYIYIESCSWEWGNKEIFICY